MYLLIWFFSLLTVYLGFKFFKRRNNIKKDIENFKEKIEKIEQEIFKEIKTRKNKPYYTTLNKEIKYYLNNINKEHLNSNKINKKRRNFLSVYLGQVDTFYVGLKSDLRMMDNFESFTNKFSKIKREYKTIFDNSSKILELMKEKYNNLVVKYLTTFQDDYNFYKQNEINEMNYLVRISKKLFLSCEFDNLSINFKKIKRLDNKVKLELNEPSRLRDKFILSEDNINRMETELVNKKGNLYYKVFKGIKNSKITPDEALEWNRIKKNINSYKKSKLLSNDVVEQSEKLNQIISDMTNLYQLVKNANHIKVELSG